MFIFDYFLYEKSVKNVGYWVIPVGFLHRETILYCTFEEQNQLVLWDYYDNKIVQVLELS